MGKARIFSSNNDDVTYQGETDSENFAMGQQNPYNLGSVHFSDQSGIGNFSQSGDDKRKANLNGALYNGNVGFVPQTAVLDVATNTINLNTDSSGVSLSVISTDRLVSLSTGTTGTLTTISGVQRPGQRLRLYNTTGNTITITHTSANTVNTIRTSDESNFTFENNMVIDLTFDSETTTQWLFVGSAGASGGTSPPFLDALNIIKGSSDATKFLKFEVDGNTTGITGTLATTFSTAKTVTLPDSTTTLAGLSTAQTFTALNTFEGGIQINDSSSNTHGLLQGIISTGTRLTLTSGEKFQIFDNITNILELDSSTGLNVKTLDVTNVDRLQISGGTSSATSVNDVVWYLNATGDLISNVNASDGWIWSSGNITKMFLTDSILEKRNVTAPSFQLYNTRTAATGTVATMSFLANSSTDSTGVSMAFLIADTEVTTGNGTGSLKLGVNVAGTLTSFLTLNDGNGSQIDLLKEVDFNSQDALNFNRIQISGGTTSATSVNDVVWYLDAAGDLVSNINASDGWIWSSGNITKMFLTDSILEKRNVTAPTFQLYNTITAQTGTAATISFLANSTLTSTGVSMAFLIANTESIASDGTGSLSLGVRVSGTGTEFMTINDGANGVVKILTALNMSTQPILALGGETINSLTADASPDSSNDFVMTYDASASGLKKVLLSNLPGGSSSSIVDADSSFTVVDGTGFTAVLDSTTLTTLTSSQMLYGVNLNMNSNSIQNPSDITLANGFSITNTSSTQTTFNVPASEDLRFTEAGTLVGSYDGGLNAWIFVPANDFSVTTTDFSVTTSDDIILNAGDDLIFQHSASEIFRYNGGNDNFTFEKDILLDNGTRIRSNDSTEIGFFVKNDTSTLGTDGSLQLPTTTTTGIGNNSDLNTHFGSGIGCMGVYGINSSVPILAIKIQSGTWALVTLPDSGTTIVGDHVT